MPRCSRDPLTLPLSSGGSVHDVGLSNQNQATLMAPRSNFSASALSKLPNDRLVMGEARIQHVLEALMPSRAVRLLPCETRDDVLKISAKPLVDTCILSLTQEGGVQVDSLHDDDGFIISFLLQGSIRVTHQDGRQNYQVAAGDGEVINRRAGAQVTTSDSHSRLMFAFPAAVARDRFEAFTQQPYSRPIEFVPTFDFRIESYLQLFNIVKCAVSDTSPDEEHRKKFSRLFEDLIFAKTFGNIPHNYTDILNEERPVGPKQLRKAEQFIRANLYNFILLDDVARAADCSPRAIQRLFQTTYGCGPIRFLRDLRLSEAHKKLASGRPVSITQLSLSLHFSNPGRFAAYYKEAYGVSPTARIRNA